MASQALYLKWRPQTFDDVVGQEHITQTLKNALRSGRVSHAYLFTGPRGTGKTTMARLLAKAVNCLDEDVNNRPCNRCPICEAINQGRLLDLIEMDAASNTGVDNVREAIREKVGFRPNQARYKVYVIDEVHMLSTSAFNALLKTLEEPPEHVIFVLATTEPHKILPTIVSRCQRHDFRRIPLAALVGRLRTIADQEGVQVEEAALRFIARMSTGCARDAIGLLDQLTAYGDELITAERVGQVLGLGDLETVRELASHLAGHAIGRGLDVIHRAVEGGADCRQFTQQIVDYLRALLLLSLGDQTPLEENDAQTRADMQALAPQFSVGQLVRAIKLFNQAQLDLRGSDQNQIALELAFVEAALEEQRALGEQRTPGEPHPPGAQRPLKEQPALGESHPPAYRRPSAEQAAAPSAAAQAPSGRAPAGEEPAVEGTETRPLPMSPARRRAQTTAPSAATSRPAAPPKATARPPADEAVEMATPDQAAAAPDQTTTTPEPAAKTPEQSARTPAPQQPASFAGPGATLTLAELEQNWAQIKQTVRAQNKQAEALLNSATIEGIEAGNFVVLAMPSRLVAEKLEKPDNREAIEQAMQAALDKACRIRTRIGQPPASAPADREPQPPFESGSAAAARRQPADRPAPAADGAQRDHLQSEIRQEALDDPVVRELERLGGQVIDVEELEHTKE